MTIGKADTTKPLESHSGRSKRLCLALQNQPYFFLVFFSLTFSAPPAASWFFLGGVSWKCNVRLFRKTPRFWQDVLWTKVPRLPTVSTADALPWQRCLQDQSEILKKGSTKLILPEVPVAKQEKTTQGGIKFRLKNHLVSRQWHRRWTSECILHVSAKKKISTKNTQSLFVVFSLTNGQSLIDHRS